MRLTHSGKLGIGVSNPQQLLEVNGNAIFQGNVESKKVKVSTSLGGWPDFVFSTNYKLRSLEELELFIKENQHLPEVPSAKEVEENGLDLGQMDATLLQKVEELTLYLLNENEENQKLKIQVTDLKKENQELKAMSLMLKKEIEIIKGGN